MDQFEAARNKHAKNLERKLRPPVELAVIEPEVIKEKAVSEPVTSGIVEVKVTLPNGVFTFTLVKPAVLQNANPSKLNRAEFLNRVRSGLEPLLGGMKEI